MADAQLKKKIHGVLKHEYFTHEDDSVDVSDGDGDCIHLVIVSRRFDGQGMLEKNDMIWSVLVKHLLPEEWGKITLTVGASPEEIKAV